MFLRRYVRNGEKNSSQYLSVLSGLLQLVLCQKLWGNLKKNLWCSGYQLCELLIQVSQAMSGGVGGALQAGMSRVQFTMISYVRPQYGSASKNNE